jgi:uncharacterized protein YbcI
MSGATHLLIERSRPVYPISQSLNGDAQEIGFDRLKTQGELEREISEGMGCFEQEYLGRGPKDVRAYLLNDLVLVRLKGVLTAAEQHLVQTLPTEKGRDLLKQVRSHLIEIARPRLATMVKGITGAEVVSLHHDISTLTGEEVVLFTLAIAPVVCETKRR